MHELERFVESVAAHFRKRLGSSLSEVYKLGSLAHGGFSATYSDIDVGMLLSCEEPPAAMTGWLAEAKTLDPSLGKKLSVFWGNPDFSWGRLPVIDRLDLLDHGVPLLAGKQAQFARPAPADIHRALRESIARSWTPRVVELQSLNRLESKDFKPYVRAVLYAARLIYTWDNLAVDSNDVAVRYLHEVRPPGLDLKPIDIALACRQEKCTAADLFALRTDLQAQYESALAYIARSAPDPS